MRFLIKWLITVGSLFVAAWLVPGITVSGNAWVAFGVTALILGLVNMFVRPVLKLLSCSVIVLTLGLFLLVINGLMLWLASYLAGEFGIGFHVHGFVSAFLGALIVSVVSTVLNWFVPNQKKSGDGDGKVTDISAA